MAAKALANGLFILGFAALALRFVVQELLGLEPAGSVLRFLLGMAGYLFFAASFGILLGTLAHAMPRLALLFILVALLSGGNTALESMPAWLQTVMQASPSTHYVSMT